MNSFNFSWLTFVTDEQVQQWQLTYLSVPFWFLSSPLAVFFLMFCSNRNVTRFVCVRWTFGAARALQQRVLHVWYHFCLCSRYIDDCYYIIRLVLYNVGICVLKPNVYDCCFDSCPVLYMKNDPFQSGSLDSFHSYRAVWLPGGIFKFCKPRCVWWSGASII